MFSDILQATSIELIIHEKNFEEVISEVATMGLDRLKEVLRASSLTTGMIYVLLYISTLLWLKILILIYK